MDQRAVEAARSQVYEATREAIRSAGLSGRGTMRGRNVEDFDYDDFSLLHRRDEHAARGTPVRPS